VNAAPEDFSAAELAARDAAAVAAAARLKAQPNLTAARPIWRYNHILGYGQSLSSGWEGWPALSTAPRHDCLMIGDSVRPLLEAGPHWQPLGEAAWRRLVAVNQSNGAGTHMPCLPLDPASVAALGAGNVALGETILEGAVNFFRGQQLRAAAMAADPAHLLAASSCGVAGRSVAQLSKGAQPELFNRLRECVRIGRALAAPDSYGVLALLCLQGEQDYAIGTTKADYKRALLQLYADVLSDVTAGQAPPPAMFSYQTGGNYAVDDGLLAVGMAQLECALEQPDWFLVAPAYPVTNKLGGHLDANGHRWLGVQFAKVMHRVLTLGETWRPLHPTGAVQRGHSILLTFHVPAPPLAFDVPYRLHAPLSFADHGFRVTDMMGDVAIVRVELAGHALVRLTLAGPPVGPAQCWYGDKTLHHGYGGLRDSDATRSDDAYEYQAGVGHAASAAIPALTGQPYKLHNWCVAFVRPAQAG
jgi:hypothetical protein